MLLTRSGDIFCMNIGQWLGYISSLSCKEMDLCLDRVQEMRDRMHLVPHCPVMTVAGTNGKGSCIAALEGIYLAAGYKVGVFTSPFLLRYNEQIRIQGTEVSDARLCQAFAAVELARKEERLTPFEFTTLAALDILKSEKCDVWLLEVGLGGRLDAVNVIDADVAIIASIGIDHTEWLGDTRELIAREKAGIFRLGRSAVCGDFQPPQSLMECADNLHVSLYCQGKDFSFVVDETGWRWQSKGYEYRCLPFPQLAMQNVSSALMAIEIMKPQLPVQEMTIQQTMSRLSLPGRMQVIPGEVMQIWDVSHNPDSVAFLAERMEKNFKGRTRAVFSMLVDKDIINTIAAIKTHIDQWYIAELPVARAAGVAVLLEAFRMMKEKVVVFPHILAAYYGAMNESKKGDRVLVFGSFHTVAEVMRCEGR